MVVRKLSMDIGTGLAPDAVGGPDPDPDPGDGYRDDGYFTLECVNEGTSSIFPVIHSGTLQYSLDDGESWSNATNNGQIGPFSRVMLRGTDCVVFLGPDGNGDQIAAYGTLYSIKDGRTDGTSGAMEGDGYYGLFYNAETLVRAPKLPATELSSWCYYQMFYNCKSLTTAPDLPATTLEESCYSNMFSGCESLTTAPKLSATTLASECYNSMFYGCFSLATAPALPATTLASSCYASMFYECTSLTTAPELPATTLVGGCYGNMFRNCSALIVKSAPAVGVAEEAWKFPHGPGTTMASTSTSQSGMFTNINAASDVSINLPSISSGNSLTYYTQNPPIT